MRKHPIGVLKPLHLGSVNPKQEILKSLMWDMGYAIWASTRVVADGIYLTSQISHLTSAFGKRHSRSNMIKPAGRGFSQINESAWVRQRIAMSGHGGHIRFHVLWC